MQVDLLEVLIANRVGVVAEAERYDIGVDGNRDC
jgi:hypothetical protein